MAQTFTPARPVARHCEELTRRGPRPEERAALITAWTRDMARDLASELGGLFSGGKLHVELSAPRETVAHELLDQIGPVAANCLLRCGQSDQPMLLSVDFATAIALTDCSFGGEGALPSSVPASLPRSAALLVDELAAIIARTIAINNGAAAQGDARGDVLVRSESVARLKPFGEDETIASFILTIATGRVAQWSVLLAIPINKLDDVLPGLGSLPRRASRVEGPGGDPMAPFAQVPLALEAVLGEFELTLSRLERLQPGDEFPLSLGREVPLRIGAQELARGTLGTMDNRLALRLGSAQAEARP